MRIAREHLDHLAAEARRLETEARAYDRAGHFVMSRDKREAAKATRARLAELQAEHERHRQTVRFG
jgi:hypothetical protein